MLGFLLASPRALRSRNYRLFFIGHGLSLIGTWMQSLASAWLVYRLTDSAFWLGAVAFAGQIPLFVFSPFAGVAADRWPRRRVLAITQSLSLLQAITLAVLALMGTVALWHILVLAILLGLVNAIDVPARQSFVSELLENPDDLSNAIALNSALFNGARLLGPALAGILIATLGEGGCFVLNALSYMAVIIALAAMRLPPAKKNLKDKPAWLEFQEGLFFAWQKWPIKPLLLLVAATSFLGSPWQALAPVFARDILRGNASLLGFLTGAFGLGALAGALRLALRPGPARLGRHLPIFAAVFGASLAAFALSRPIPLAMVFLVAAGFSLISFLASANAILQDAAGAEMRGRVMAFYAMSLMGVTPLGNLAAGWTAEWLGAPATVVMGGIGCASISLVFLWLLVRMDH